MIQCKCYKEDTYIQKADVDNWIEIWIERKSPLVKESTFAAYSNILVNHLLPTFGELELTEITERSGWGSDPNGGVGVVE